MVRLAGTALAALAVAGSLSAQAAPGPWTIDAAASRLIVHVLPAGLLSSALHPHHFEPGDWSGEFSRDPDHPGALKGQVRVAADSLRDRQPKLSAGDVAKVESRVRSAEILDAGKHPRIVFDAKEFEFRDLPAGESGDFHGTLSGALTLHGRTRPLKFAVQGRLLGETLEASGTVAFKQSEFGIRPYSTALGTVAVRDEVTVEFALVARIGRH